MHKTQFMLLLNDMKRKLLACFLSAIIVVQYFIFQYDQLVFLIPDFILLIAY